MVKSLKIPIIIALIFTIAYAALSIVRHSHYGSFGYDLGIEDQITWKFSQFELPISTISDTPFVLSFKDHVEFIYMLLAPFYWIWDSVYFLLILQSFFFCFSAIPMFLLAEKYKLKPIIMYAVLIGYLMFYGV
ncbi:MAG: DUF2079 domain-containing protein, partial [Patescibacteria group bacterium]|nr:DUF2079 domain-containing protein [Patescibacteria group bacterium]